MHDSSKQRVAIADYQQARSPECDHERTVLGPGWEGQGQVSSSGLVKDRGELAHQENQHVKVDLDDTMLLAIGGNHQPVVPVQLYTSSLSLAIKRGRYEFAEEELGSCS